MKEKQLVGKSVPTKDLKGWTRVTSSTLPEPHKTVLLVDSTGRKAIGSLLARTDTPLGCSWVVNGTSGFIVEPPLFWREYPELPNVADLT